MTNDAMAIEEERSHIVGLSAIAYRSTAIVPRVACRGYRTVVAPVAATMAILFSSNAFSDEGDDTLAYYLAKSDVVLAGEVSSAPSAVSSEVGVVEYSFKVKVMEVLQGEIRADEQPAVTIIRFESNASDAPPWLRKGAKAVFFLRNRPDLGRRGYTSADPWFAAQPYNAALAKRIRRIAAAEGEKPTTRDGVVLCYNDQRAELSIGRDDGVKSSESLYWFRGEEMLGQLIVTSVEKNTCTAEILRRFGQEFGMPRRNDRVSMRPPR